MTNNNNQVNITFRALNSDFNKSVREINAESTRLRQEFRLQEAQIASTASETDRIALRVQALNEQYAVSQRRTAETNTYLQRARDLYGENSVEAGRFQDQLVSAQIAEQNLANQIQRTIDSQQRQERSLRDLSQLFQVTETSVQDFENVLGRDLVAAINNGTATARQLDSAFDRISRSAIDTGVNVNELRSTLDRLRSGGDIDEIRRDVDNLRDSFRESDSAASSLNQQVTQLASGLAGAAAGALGLQTALQQGAQNTQIDLVFDVDDRGTEVVREAIDNVRAFGVDGREALEGVRRQFALNTDATDEQNAALARNAAALTQLYAGLDFTEVIQEAREIAGTIGITTEEALNLTDQLLAVGFPPEQLDIIAEYGSQLRRAGFEAEEIQAIFATASNSGAFNVDLLLDGLKEGRIRASELGLGLSEGFRDALRQITDGSNTITEEEVERITQRNLAQETALEESLDRQLQNRRNALGREEDALETSLDNQLQAVTRSQSQQEQALRRSLQNELTQFNSASDQRLNTLEREYRERLRLTNEEEYNRLRAIDAEIAGINGLIEADAQAVRTTADNERRSELQRAVQFARTNRNREIAQEELAEFEQQLAARNLLEDRRNRIANLSEQRSDVQEIFNEREQAITDEYNSQQEALRNSIDLERSAIQERQGLQLESYREQSRAYLTSVRNNNAADLQAFRETNAEKLRLLESQQSLQLSQVESRNAIELETRINPPDSAEFTRLVNDIQNLGRSVADASDGAGAFSQITAFLRGIEDATLQNAVGVELFGVQYEDQANELLFTLENYRDAIGQTGAAQEDLSKRTERYAETSLVEYQQAIVDLQRGLAPILGVISGIVGVISTFVTAFPGFSGLIVTLATLAAGVSGALFVLQPIIGIFGGLTPILTSLSTAFAGVGTFITGVANVALPLLTNALRFLLGPAGAITLLVSAAILVVRNWDTVVSFFQGFASFITGVFTGLGDLLSAPFENARNNVYSILDGIRDRFAQVFQNIQNNIQTVLQGFGNFFRAPINVAIDALNYLIRAFNQVSFDIPDFIPGIGGRRIGFDIPEAQYFADGGILNRATVFGRQGGRELIGGEAGPEAIIPLRADVLAGIGRGIQEAANINNATSTIVNFEGIFNGATLNLTSEDSIRQLSRELYDYQQRGVRGR